VSGEQEIALCATTQSVMSLDWDDTDHIVFAQRSPQKVEIVRVPGSGGDCARVAELGSPDGVTTLQSLPDGRGVLLSLVRSEAGNLERHVVVQPLDGSAPRAVMDVPATHTMSPPRGSWRTGEPPTDRASTGTMPSRCGLQPSI
jgi:hypothetical protein